MKSSLKAGKSPGPSGIIIQNYLCKKKSKSYVYFVNFQKGFDSVHRDKLWQVLKTTGVKTNLFKVVKDMYKCVKARVKINGEYTDDFDCPVGLKQGCLLSSLIFPIFIFFPDLIEIILLLFADDIALISDPIGGLQRQLEFDYSIVKNIK